MDNYKERTDGYTYGDFSKCIECKCNTCYDNPYCDPCAYCRFDNINVKEQCIIDKEEE